MDVDLYSKWYGTVFGNEVYYNPSQRYYQAGPFILSESILIYRREFSSWLNNPCLMWDVHVKQTLRKGLETTYNRFLRKE